MSRHGLGFALLALIVAGDLLFWTGQPSLSLALFAGLVFAAARGLRGRGAATAHPALLLAVGALPVIEHVQPLSFVCLVLSLAVSVAWLDIAGPGSALRAARQRLLSLPVAGLRDMLRAVSNARRCAVRGEALAEVLAGWALPVGGALVLASLLMLSNPLFDRWVAGFGKIHIDMARLLLWAGLALAVWPFLTVTRGPSEPAAWRWPSCPAAWNAAAVARTLLVFNGLMGIQTALDMTYLWSGAPLPDGVTLASYAHRGAYPLLATALLAGVFAALARPFLENRRGLRMLVLLWLAQNLALTAAAARRLDLYVGEFGLTYLRLYAAVWMGVVALGLLLTAWQVARRRSLRWLVLRCAMLAATTLYLACFVNFGAIVVQQNLARGSDDHAYLCSLPETARATLPCGTPSLQIDGWRDWSFREWRAIRYVGAMKEGRR